MCSLIKYCPNANNLLQLLLSNKSEANPNSIHKYVFINTKFFKFADHVIWVQNTQKEVYLFMGHLVLYAQYQHIVGHFKKFGEFLDGPHSLCIT